jgi:hypothetical protein
MPRRDGEVFLFGTAMGTKLLKNAIFTFEAGLIEEGARQG